MDNLPAEILGLIFPFLVQRDKLECMTVCRQWHSIIFHHSLFQVIYIDRLTQLNNLIKRIQSNPNLGKKVERLIFKSCFYQDHDATFFPQLFPNLREFISMMFVQNSSIQQLEKHPWCEQTEIMIEDNSDLSTRTLLLSGLCKSLTYISICGEDGSARTLIRALANAPALKSLQLHNYTLNFLDLELLHENVPLLNSLFLRSLESNDEFIMHNIKPATSLKTFQCVSDNFSSFNGLKHHLPYISQKYIHIEEMSLEFEADEFEDNEIDVEIDKRALILSYMKILGPRLTTLLLHLHTFELDTADESFDLNMLDECDFQIKKLNLGPLVNRRTLEQLEKTRQVQSIQSLTISRMLADDNGSISLKWLAPFTKLKELNIHFPTLRKPWRKFTASLDNILENLRDTKLESLTLSSLLLKLNDSNTTPIYPSLRNLTLNCVAFGTGTDICLSQTFPNLRHLKLSNYFIKQESLMLPNLDLSYLEVVDRSTKEAIPVMLTTFADRRQRLYKASTIQYDVSLEGITTQQDASSLRHVCFQPYDKSINFPMIKIACNSVYNFCFEKKW